MIRFKVYMGRELVEELAFEYGPIHLGRASDNEIVLDHESVSRKHARITREETSWLIEKLPGTNPLVVNGNVCPYRVLKPDDRVEVWRYIVEFLGEDGDASKLQEGTTGQAAGGAQSLPGADELDAQMAGTGDTTVTLSMADFVKVHGQTQKLMGAHITWRDSERQEQVAVLKGDRTVLGRSQDSDICFPTGFPTVKHYAALHKGGDSYSIEPLSRLVSVEVNGEAVKGARQLADGDRIQVGKQTLEFRAPM